MRRRVVANRDLRRCERALVRGAKQPRQLERFGEVGEDLRLADDLLGIVEGTIEGWIAGGTEK